MLHMLSDDAFSSIAKCMLQVANNKRYAAASGKGFTVTEVAQHVKDDVGKIDILVHSLANGPEVTKPLLETSRRVSLHNYWVCPHVKQNKKPLIANWGIAWHL